MNKILPLLPLLFVSCSTSTCLYSALITGSSCIFLGYLTNQKYCYYKFEGKILISNNNYNNKIVYVNIYNIEQFKKYTENHKRIYYDSIVRQNPIYFTLKRDGSFGDSLSLHTYYGSCKEPDCISRYWPTKIQIRVYDQVRYQYLIDTTLECSLYSIYENQDNKYWIIKLPRLKVISEQ
jgi:hypothetical protein